MDRLEITEAGFTEATEETVKNLTNAEAFPVVGGGDTVAAIEALDVVDQLGFVSTGGGAMLTYLEHRSTPVLDVNWNNKNRWVTSGFYYLGKALSNLFAMTF